jgi:hypothetical protein
MGIVYRIDQEKGITFVRWDGVVTAEDFIAHVLRLTSDASWPPPGRLHLSDLRSASLDIAKVDEAILEKAAKLFGRHPEKIAKMKAAIVANEAFKKSVSFEHYAAPYGLSVIVFNTLHTACIWLGIDAGEAEGALRQLRA